MKSNTIIGLVIAAGAVFFLTRKKSEPVSGLGAMIMSTDKFVLYVHGSSVADPTVYSTQLTTALRQASTATANWNVGFDRGTRFFRPLNTSNDPPVISNALLLAWGTRLRVAMGRDDVTLIRKVA